MKRPTYPALPIEPGRRRALAMIGAPLLAAPLLSLPAMGQSRSYPSRAVRIVCPYGSGSPVDITGRYMAELLHAELGEAFILENIAGAGGTLGAASVLRSASDGYTLLTQFSSALVTTQFLYPSVQYDVMDDFVPIWSLMSSGTVFVVRAESPYQTLQQFLDAAKAKPGVLNYASSGVGSPPHINAEMFMRETGVDFAHVPYRSGGHALTDLLGGHVDCMFSSISAAKSMIEEGRLRGLAVLRDERADELPMVPTLAEGGVEGWLPPRSVFGLYAPKGTPDSVISLLRTTLNGAHEKNAEGRARMKTIGLAGVIDGPAFAELTQREYDTYRALIEEAGISADI